VSFLAITVATIVGFQVVRSEGLGLSGIIVLNFVLLTDAATLFYAEARLKEKKKRKRSGKAS